MMNTGLRVYEGRQPGHEGVPTAGGLPLAGPTTVWVAACATPGRSASQAGVLGRLNPCLAPLVLP